MKSYLLEHEAALRVPAFLLVLAAMAAWERAAPAGTPSEPWWRRRRTNLGLAAANSLLLRVALPTTAIAVAGFAQANGWGLPNHYGVGGWVALVVAVVAHNIAREWTGRGNFYAEPLPDVRLHQPGLLWHGAKMLYEKYWLFTKF